MTMSIQSTLARSIFSSRFRLWLLIPILGLPWGCTSSSRIYLNTRRPMVLGRTEAGADQIEVYKLDLGPSNAMNLVVRTERKEPRPRLGLTLVEIGKNLGQRKMLDPYRGLFVERVEPKGPADRAGLLPGDVVLALNGVELRYDEQLQHVLATRIDVETEVELRVLRGLDNRQEVRVKFIPESREVVIPTTRAITLEPPQVTGPSYAGIITGTLPAEWTEKIYGENRATVLVGGVYVGSPAYLAGIRAGDRILTVNGRHFESATELKQQIMDWGASGEKATFEVVQQPGGRYSCEVALRDYSGDSRIYVPLVFKYVDTTTETDWDLGPGGLIMGYAGEYRRADSRSTNYERSFSMLLGLYRRKWWPDRCRTRLLWFIKLDSN